MSPVMTTTCHQQGMGLSREGWVCPGGREGEYVQRVVGVVYPRSDGIPPPVLTPSGSHQNTFSWQAGCMHPTGILSSLA